MILKSLRYMSSIKTKFIDYKNGPPQNLFLNQRQITPSEDEHLMKIKAVGINRAQCLHRMGRYPINNQKQKYIGLQASGEVIDPKTGNKLFDGIALLSGGGYSQYASIPKTHVMPLPKNLKYAQGAGIPQAWITAYLLLRLADLKKGDKVVIYAGASGVGTACIQICNLLGYIPYAVVSGPQKGELTKKVGVREVVYYKNNQNWSDQLIKLSGSNFQAVLDCVGPGNADHTLKLLAVDGKWIFYGTLSGLKGQLNYGMMIGKRITLIPSTLKTRSKQYKDQLIQQFSEKILKEFETDKVHPVISEIIKCDWKSADCFIQAHKTMESNQNAGKIIIEFQ